MAGTPTAWPVHVEEAKDLARLLLDERSERWRHTLAVAHRAEGLVPTIGRDQPDVLVAAAWLHDIGYASLLTDTGFHPLDGARYLSRYGWPNRIAALVANHSGARLVAAESGLSRALSIYPNEETPLSDALTYADQTVGPNGQRMTVHQRMAEMLNRHGEGSPEARAHPLRGPHLLAVAERVEQRLATGR